MWPAIYEECPQAEVTLMATKFGIQSKIQVLKALRGEHWLYQHPDAKPALVAGFKKSLRHAFGVDTPDWKEKIVTGHAGLCAGRGWFGAKPVNPVVPVKLMKAGAPINANHIPA